jgi:hypothetical protein
MTSVGCTLSTTLNSQLNSFNLLLPTRPILFMKFPLASIEVLLSTFLSAHTISQFTRSLTIGWFTVSSTVSSLCASSVRPSLTISFPMSSSGCSSHSSSARPLLTISFLMSSSGCSSHSVRASLLSCTCLCSYKSTVVVVLQDDQHVSVLLLAPFLSATTSTIL